MGWCRSEAPGHEGFVVGIEGQDLGGRVEMRYPTHKETTRVHVIKVGCECGWRSQALYAPLLAKWRPYMVTMPESCEDAARVIWGEHVNRDGNRSRGLTGFAAQVTGAAHA